MVVNYFFLEGRDKNHLYVHRHLIRHPISISQPSNVLTICLTLKRFFKLEQFFYCK